MLVEKKPGQPSVVATKVESTNGGPRKLFVGFNASTVSFADAYRPDTQLYLVTKPVEHLMTPGVKVQTSANLR